MRRHSPVAVLFLAADAELEQIKDGLHTLAAPEQFFGANWLRLTHDASGTTVSFTALDALKGWLADKSGGHLALHRCAFLGLMVSTDHWLVVVSQVFPVLHAHFVQRECK